MPRYRTWFVLGVSASSFLIALPARAQTQSPVAGPVLPPLPVTWAPPAPEASLALPNVAPVRTDGDKDHTVTGLLIGAGVGLVAGYAFYDVICEAVDNRCSDSRFPLLVLGAGVGGSLGALLGSLVD